MHLSLADFGVQVLVSGPGAKETSHQRSSDPGPGDLAGVPGPRSAQCHQRGLQELRQNHPECQRPRSLRLRGRTGESHAKRWLYKYEKRSSNTGCTILNIHYLWILARNIAFHDFYPAQFCFLHLTLQYIMFVLFVPTQEHIYKLMKSDSYSRFIRSSAYQELLQAKKKVKKTRILIGTQDK